VAKQLGIRRQVVLKIQLDCPVESFSPEEHRILMGCSGKPWNKIEILIKTAAAKRESQALKASLCYPDRSRSMALDNFRKEVSRARKELKEAYIQRFNHEI